MDSLLKNYENMWKAFIRPHRQVYNMHDLGQPMYTLQGTQRKIKRHDFELMNKRGLKLKCSIYKFADSNYKTPIVVYLHCNTGSRIEGLVYVDQLLKQNICVCIFDFAGSGISDGEYISLGWFETEDVEIIIQHIRQTQQFSGICLWGRSMGASTAIIYGSKDQNIVCSIYDSPFSSLVKLAQEIGVEKTGIPRFIISGALQLIKQTIQTKARFDIDDLEIVQMSKICSVPGLFVSSKQDTFTNYGHTETLKKAYRGRSQLLLSDSQHNEKRSIFVNEQIIKFICQELQQSYIERPQVTIPTQQVENKENSNNKMYSYFSKQIKINPNQNSVNSDSIQKQYQNNATAIKQIKIDKIKQENDDINFTVHKTVSTPQQSNKHSLKNTNNPNLDQKYKIQFQNQQITEQNQQTERNSQNNQSIINQYKIFNEQQSYNTSNNQKNLDLDYQRNSIDMNNYGKKAQNTSNNSVENQYQNEIYNQYKQINPSQIYINKNNSIIQNEMQKYYLISNCLLSFSNLNYKINSTQIQIGEQQNNQSLNKILLDYNQRNRANTFDENNDQQELNKLAKQHNKLSVHNYNINQDQNDPENNYYQYLHNLQKSNHKWMNLIKVENYQNLNLEDRQSTQIISRTNPIQNFNQRESVTKKDQTHTSQPRNYNINQFYRNSIKQKHVNFQNKSEFTKKNQQNQDKNIFRNIQTPTNSSQNTINQRKFQFSVRGSTNQSVNKPEENMIEFNQYRKPSHNFNDNSSGTQSQNQSPIQNRSSRNNQNQQKMQYISSEKFLLQNQKDNVEGPIQLQINFSKKQNQVNQESDIQFQSNENTVLNYIRPSLQFVNPLQKNKQEFFKKMVKKQVEVNEIQCRN